MTNPIDPGLVEAAKNTIIAGTGILCSKELLLKIFGPTADFLGEGLKSFSERGAKNVENILRKTLNKMKGKAEDSGEVPPKVMKGLLFEGPFVEDEISAEYFGGVLASSKSENSRDDRGATYLNLLSSLSTYQIRTHYILYSLLRNIFFSYRQVVSPGTDRGMMYIYIPTETYYTVMDIESDFSTDDQKLSILAHSMNGMKRLNLVEDFRYGKPDIFLQDNIMYKFREYPINDKKLAEHGLTIEPTPGGMELFLWAHGLGHIPHQQFLNEDLIFDQIQGIELPKNAIILYESLIKARLETWKNNRDQ